MTYNILYDQLSDEESTRLYSHFPELRGKCPTCRGNGIYVWQGKEHDCDCTLQKQLAKHYSAAGIGRPYQLMDWPDYTEDPGLLTVVAHYLDNYEAFVDRGMGLLLYGPNGVGKTLLAYLTLKELVKKGWRGERFTAFASTFSATVESLTAGWNDAGEKKWFARQFIQSRVLLLDDLGKERKTKNDLPETTFDNILRTRVQNARPTILTTNLNPDDLGKGYGGSVLSLLRECSVVEEVKGKDWRGKAHQRTMDEIDRGETRPIV